VMPVGELGECAASAPFCSWLMPARSMSSPLDMCRLKVRCCRSLHARASSAVIDHCCPDLCLTRLALTSGNRRVR
jgi:hypothetical protein